MCFCFVSFFAFSSKDDTSVRSAITAMALWNLACTWDTSTLPWCTTCRKPFWSAWQISLSYFFSPFEELLIWVRAPWADNWLRLWRQPWQRQRCRGQEHTGSNAFPSPARRVLKTISNVTLVLPLTVPSFFPSALSNSTPAHIPIANGGFEMSAWLERFKN